MEIHGFFTSLKKHCALRVQNIANQWQYTFIFIARPSTNLVGHLQGVSVQRK